MVFLTNTEATPDQSVQQRVAFLFQADYSDTVQEGTYFSQRLRQGNTLTDAGLFNEFALAGGMVIKQIGNQSALPASEQVKRLRLSSFTRSSETLLMTITLVMADNSTKIIPHLTIAA